MAFHETYTQRGVLLNYGLVDITTGISSVDIAENNERVSFRKDISGDTAATVNADNSYTLTLSYFPESRSAKILRTAYQAMRSASTADAVLGDLPFTISEPSGAMLLTAEKAVIQSIGNTTLGEDTGTVDVVMYLESAYVLGLPADIAQDVNTMISALNIEIPFGPSNN